MLDIASRPSVYGDSFDARLLAVSSGEAVRSQQGAAFCFASRVLTSSGEKPICALSPNDKLISREAGYVKIVDVRRARRMSARSVCVLLPQNTMNNHDELMLFPEQRLVIKEKRKPEKYIKAITFVRSGLASLIEIDHTDIFEIRTVQKLKSAYLSGQAVRL